SSAAGVQVCAAHRRRSANLYPGGTGRVTGNLQSAGSRARFVAGFSGWSDRFAQEAGATWDGATAPACDYVVSPAGAGCRGTERLRPAPVGRGRLAFGPQIGRASCRERLLAYV